MKSHSARIAFSIVTALSLTGCNTGQFPVKMAKGQVTCDGKPVTSGSIQFTPIGTKDGIESGKPASATVDSDGTFVLSTYGRFDGAIVGKHRVQYDAAAGDEEGEDENDDGGETVRKSDRQKNKKRESTCVQTEEIILEVMANGQNNFKIELKSKLR
jgi:hypothetical protein